MNRFIDTHCHLNFTDFTNDVEVVIQRAVANGVERIIVPGIDLETNKRALQLAEQYPGIYAAVGIHPNSENDLALENLQVLREQALHPKVVAIGEIGLDHHRQIGSDPLQLELLVAQLELAFELKLPILLHNRDSSEELINILSNWIHSHGILLGTFHAFMGDTQIASFAKQQGFKLGIGGSVTYNKNLIQYLKMNNLIDLFILETDSPLMTPIPFRGKRNEPGNIPNIAQSLSNVTGVEYQQISIKATQNALDLFWK